MFHGFSWTVNEQLECVGHDAGSHWGRARRWRRWRLKLCPRQIYPMRFWVELHRSRAAFRFQSLHGPEFLRRLFFHDVCHSFAARREDKLRRIVKSRAINACADGCGGDDFAALSIEHGHHLVVAGGEESMMRGVERNPTWLFARRERPMRHHLMLGGIDR